MLNHKEFKHLEKPNFPTLVRFNQDGKRRYRTPEGNVYPSVTTVLDTLSKPAIDAWKKRVGKVESERVLEYARNTGTPIHTLFELYIGNQKPSYMDIQNPLQRNMFLSVKKELDKIDNVLCQEQPLYSDILRLAGTADLIAEFDGKKSVIDFKTSRRFKTEEHIKSYFMQTTIYSLMLEELTGLVYPYITIILVTYSGETAVFQKHRKEYYKEVFDLLNELNKQ